MGKKVSGNYLKGVLAFYGIGMVANLNKDGKEGYKDAENSFSEEMKLFEKALAEMKDKAE